ncbi:MAG: M48 family metalloprotease [Bdellovibrionales bacterium]|nr:M48 family metalloprotease [Bdellovibrionales bacterium]
MASLPTEAAAPPVPPLPELQWATHPHLAFAAIVAIPVVAFALWAQYAQGDLEIRKGKDQDWDADREVGRVRVMGIFGLAVQAVIYVASFGLSDVNRLLPFSLFLTALTVQNIFCAKLEALIRSRPGSHRLAPRGSPRSESEGGSVPAPDRPSETQLLGLGFRIMGWMLTSVLVYLGVIQLFVRVALAAAKATGLEESTGNLLALSGLALGIFAGLALSFALAPFYLRRILPVKRLEPGVLLERLEKCFSEAKVPVPSFWMVDTRIAAWSQVLYSGFPSGRGPFRPSVFLSQPLTEKLGEQELRAALLREAAHVRLKHFRNRLWVGFLAGAGCIAIAGVMILSAQDPALDPALASFLRAMAVLVTLAGPFLSVRALVRRQEEIADLHAVAELGADVESLVGLLVKLEILSGRLSGPGDSVRKSRETVASAGALAHRIGRLRLALESRGLWKPEANPAQTEVQNRDDDVA